MTAPDVSEEQFNRFLDSLRPHKPWCDTTLCYDDGDSIGHYGVATPIEFGSDEDPVGDRWRMPADGPTLAFPLNIGVPAVSVVVGGNAGFEGNDYMTPSEARAFAAQIVAAADAVEGVGAGRGDVQ
ncbi:hypothetical protein [Litorihabitans aurantiacus]|uniref:Uncharacterized protein n=1 Tax=Litorihabitans aurantiacus TaxID=1930061 RepID=A0AA37XII5_9MICO|nr:hypothetical protein [Litorihabitans aurantiacus]GMA33619.1 hypothetical protein GCM10025875_36110 [Litorihabitans aurantiacus]